MTEGVGPMRACDELAVPLPGGGGTYGELPVDPDDAAAGGGGTYDEPDPELPAAGGGGTYDVDPVGSPGGGAGCPGGGMICGLEETPPPPAPPG